MRACRGENCSDNEERASLVVVVITQDENDEEEEERDEMLINGPDHLALCLSLLFLLLQLLLPFYIE